MPTLRLLTMASAAVQVFAVLFSPIHQPVFAASGGAPLSGRQAEEFLKSAKVVKLRPVPIGVTAPQQATLTDGTITARALWKTIDVYLPVKRFQDGGMPEIGFTDSYKHECAAYELDKLLGSELVPPAVERRIRSQRGSMQLWIEDTITETERLKRKLQAPDLELWNRQIYNVRLLRQLTYDTDFNNTGNLLVDPEFRVYAIDHSRAFRLHEELRAEGDLTRFSRTLLDHLRALDAETLKQRMGRWLTKGQREALLARRDRILERAERLVAEQGEERVLFP